MKKTFFFVILILALFTGITFSQVIKGQKGPEVRPYIFNMRDLPSMGDMYVGPVYKGDFNEAEPPYAPPYPPPDVSTLPNFTYDKSANEPRPFAPITGTNFEGITYTNSIPSEPQPAVGPNHVFSLGNVSVKISNKSGTTLSSVTQASFFNIPSAEGAGFDSKCFYDYRRGRFVALCETQTTSPNVCKYYLAISATSDAMGTWYRYAFDMTVDGSTQTSNWSDFPGLGISDDKLVMSGQQFTFSSNSYQYQKLRVIDRAIAYTGAAVSYVDFVNWSGQVFVTKPGRNMSSGNDIYLLATGYSGGTSVQFRTITGTPSSPVLSSATTISVSSYGAAINMVPGGSSSNTINCGDCRTPDFFVRNGVLNIAFHMGATINSTSVNAIRFLRIQVNPLNTTPLTDETYGAASTYYYYPMVCLDSVGTMFMGFGRSSTSEFPSSYVTGKRRGDVTIQSSTLAKAGTAVYSPPFGGYYRWGDFTGIDMDESATGRGASYAWYAGQWTKTATVFGTWITQLSYTYGQIAGQVLNDADGDVSTTGDRTPYAGVTVTLKQGTTVLNTTLTDASGNYNFGYLETATNYSVVFSPPSPKHSVDVVPGSGGTSQSKTDYKTIAVNLTNAQTSTGNNYIISDWLTTIASGNWNSTSTWTDAATPTSTEKVLITSAYTVTINSNFTCQNINDKGVLQFDNVSPRTLTISGSLNLANGNITLGNNTIVAGSVTGASASRYIVTNGTGTLNQNISNNNTYVSYPVGPTASAYNPVNIQLDNASTTDVFAVRVSNTITNTPAKPTEVIQKEWTITEGTPGGSNATIQFSFGTADFGSGFNTGLGNYDIGRYNSGYTVYNGIISGPVSSLYTITSSQKITGFSPFIVGNGNSVLGASIYSLTLKALLQGYFNGTTMVPKNVKVMLRNSTSPYALVDSNTVLLNSSGSASPSFTKAANGIPYYIVLKFNNGIETWSATAQTFNGSTLSYDFTTAASQAYGSNEKLVGTKYCVYVGDVNQDGVIDFTDLALVDNDNTNFVTGATLTDLNGDLVVDFSDLAICDNNNINFISAIKPPGAPGSFEISQNYPNPASKIDFNITYESKVLIKLFDIKGHEVMTLVDADKQPGNYIIQLDKSNLYPGIYYYSIVTEGNGHKNISVKKILVIK